MIHTAGTQAPRLHDGAIPEAHNVQVVGDGRFGGLGQGGDIFENDIMWGQKFNIPNMMGLVSMLNIRDVKDRVLKTTW